MPKFNHTFLITFRWYIYLYYSEHDSFQVRLLFARFLYFSLLQTSGPICKSVATLEMQNYVEICMTCLKVNVFTNMLQKICVIFGKKKY